MASSSSLVVPMLMWGPQAPTHCISAIYLLRDQRTLVTGGSDGQIILWVVDSVAQPDQKWNFTPRHMLVGHTAPVKCIAKASSGQDCHHIVSSSENGEMFTWDTVDGRALESKRYQNFVHTSIQAYRTPDSAQVRLFCCGFYEEIVVVEPFSLEILFQLASRTCPDWISSFHVLRPRNRKDDVVLALTTTGTVKVWTLSGDEQNTSDPIFENESKQIRCINALTMSCCVYNMRTVLVVCNTYWNIYDAGDFTCLLTVDCRKGERWLGGEFISAERVCVWSDDGKAYLYKLPTNCIVESKDFHNKSKIAGGKSLLFCELTIDMEENLTCPPAFKYLIFTKDGKWMKYLLRGDCFGRLVVWKIPDTPDCASMQLKHETSHTCSKLEPQVSTSLADIWHALVPKPVGVLNQLDDPECDADSSIALTATIFLPMQCRLVCGREDGSIVMVPATQTIMLHLLSGKHQKFTNWPHHQVLLGHSARVNCLLYPNNDHPRYDVAHLLSGSVDFTVCLWDIYTGTLLHRFGSHAGEISNLYVPPASCSPRVQNCICSVASDNSVALLSLKERKCIMLASRHLFPVTTIKWRPLDDFLIVGCSDGTTYVWQIETGHLDRVVHGTIAEDIFAACDENATVNISDNVGANPALHFFRGLRHRNLAAIKLATQSGISHLQGNKGPIDQIRDKTRAFPLVINGYRTNPKDAEGHILFFDVEALIVQLLTEEYGAMTPGTLEAQGFTNQKEYEKIWALTRPASPDTAKKIAGVLKKVKDRADEKINSMANTSSPETQKRLTGIMAKVKEGAEKAKEELDKAKSEFEKRAGALDESAVGNKESESVRPANLHLEINLTLEIGQLLLSLLHAWGLDKDLDKVATSKLGLLRPKVPVSYGILSKGGVMSLTLPTWYPRPNPEKPLPMELKPTHISNNLSKSEITREMDTYYFTALGHWELSHTVTTNHLLSVISITNTLVSVSNASFIPEQERKRKLVRQATHGAMDLPAGSDANFSHVQEQIKQGWSLLSTLHCLLLSGKLKHLGSKSFKKPQVEFLAQRWQDRCLQIRLAAQELLVAELKNLGHKGRKHLVEVWGQFLPKYGDPPFQNNLANNHHHSGINGNGTENGAEEEVEIEEEDEDEDANSSAVQAKRNQTTSVILLGVIGALFDLEAEKEGKEVALGNHLTRLTAKALMFLVLSPNKQTSSGPLRRAAIDIIGRGFIIWEPHLEVSKVLLGLFEMCCEADWWVPSNKYGLPLTPSGDSCRTSRHALGLIALVRPEAFITSVAKEIARYNNLATNAQALQINLAAHVLTRSKAEILHLLEMLILNNRQELSGLMVDVVDIILHCIDHNHLKNKPMSDIFSPICQFPQVSHCLPSRRIGVGTKSGQLAIYELRASKVQMLNAHSGSVVAVAFGPDGKNLASYSPLDNRLCFWQTSTGMFGLGNAQTKCTRTYNTPTLAQAVKWNPMYSPKLVWTTPKTVTLMLPDGTEHRFNC